MNVSACQDLLSVRLDLGLKSVKELQAKIKKKDSEAFGQVAAMQAIIDQQASHINKFQNMALEACEFSEIWADKARKAQSQRKTLMDNVERALIRRACSAIKRRVMNQWHGRCAKTSLLINIYHKFKRTQQMRSVERVIREWAGVTSNSTRISTHADRQVMVVQGRAVQQCLGQWTHHTR